jgi:hypothetical protein
MCGISVVKRLSDHTGVTTFSRLMEWCGWSIARRLEDTKKELHSLLKQEKLMSATLLIFCNKTSPVVSRLMRSRIFWLWMKLTQDIGALSLAVQEPAMDWIVNDIAARIFTYM